MPKSPTVSSRTIDRDRANRALENLEQGRSFSWSLSNARSAGVNLDGLELRRGKLEERASKLAERIRQELIELGTPIQVANLIPEFEPSP